MAHAIHPAPRSSLSRWFLVAFTLMGFLGQLLIQSQAMPGEMPRATILRLTGIDIAPHVYHTPHKHSVCADMPSMAMDNVTQAVSADNEGDHDHMSGHPAHHDGSCPLCPLLHLPVFLFTALVILLALAFIRWQRHVNIVNPRAPPVITLGVPFSCGPPVSAVF